jgi:PadR family transcriptional regulator, regulatory protein AphA
MEHTVITSGNKSIVECLPESGMVTDENSALGLVSICAEESTDILLLHHSNLHSDFFDLKTGLAGKVLLKLSNYQIHAAAVVPSELIGNGRFYEFVLETNRRDDFRVYTSREDAIEWLENL